MLHGSNVIVIYEIIENLKTFYYCVLFWFLNSKEMVLDSDFVFKLLVFQIGFAFCKQIQKRFKEKRFLV